MTKQQRIDAGLAIDGRKLFGGKYTELRKQMRAFGVMWDSKELLWVFPSEKVLDDFRARLPEGAIAKDGPSAGVTIATALISALSQRPVRHDVGMTGEITLRGRVLAIGAFKETIMAARRAGLKKVIVPQENRRDLANVPPKAQRDLEFVFVRRMEEVLQTALLDSKATEGKEAD